MADLPKLQAFYICENIIVDQSNRVSTINIFNSLSIRELNGLFAFKIFASFFVSEGLHKISMTLTKPDGKDEPIFGQEKMFGFSEKLDFQIIAGIQVTHFGNYIITLYVDEVILSTTELLVSLKND